MEYMEVELFKCGQRVSFTTTPFTLTLWTCTTLTMFELGMLHSTFIGSGGAVDLFYVNCNGNMTRR